MIKRPPDIPLIVLHGQDNIHNHSLTINIENIEPRDPRSTDAAQTPSLTVNSFSASTAVKAIDHDPTHALLNACLFSLVCENPATVLRDKRLT